MPLSQVDLREGESLHLTCHFNSSFPNTVTYNWYKDHMEQVGTQGELEVKDMAAKDAGIYHCMVQNEVGATESHNITVKGRIHSRERCCSSAPWVRALTGSLQLAPASLSLPQVGLSEHRWHRWSRGHSGAPSPPGWCRGRVLAQEMPAGSQEGYDSGQGSRGWGWSRTIVEGILRGRVGVRAWTAIPILNHSPP